MNTIRQELKSLKAPLKIVFPIWAVFFIFAVSVFFGCLPWFRSTLLEQKKEMIQGLTDNAVSLLAYYHQKAVSGEMDTDAARAAAMAQVRHLRYGAGGKDYFWIHDMHPFIIMHPFRPDLEGRDASLVRDVRGNYPFMGMVEKVMNQGSGYVDYYWQWKDDPDRIAPKLSYVKGFAPWGWVVGTGIYTEDVRQEVQGLLGRLTRVFSGILVFVLVLSAYMTWQSIRIRNRKKAVEQDLKREKETLSMILQSIPHGVALIDSCGRYVYVNPYFTTITGYDLKDIPTREAWFKKVYPDHACREKVMAAWERDSRDQGLGEFREFRILCRDGQSKSVEFRSFFKGDLKVSVLTDLSDREASEATRREKDRLQGVLETSGAVCHEMNQPLMSALGYLDLARMDLAGDDDRCATLNKIHAQLERMSDITKTLMEISRYRTKDYPGGRILDLSGTSEFPKKKCPDCSGAGDRGGRAGRS